MKKITKLLFVCILCLTSFLAFATFTKASKKVNAATVPEGQTLDTQVDTVSIKDLTIGESTGNQLLPTRPGDNNATYNKTSANGSLKLQFKYEVDDATAVDSNSLYIYLGVTTNTWNDSDGCAFLFRGDGIYTLRYNGSWGYHSENALSKGLFTIEVGRIAIFDGGNPTGNYYCYYKVDGTEVYSTINPYNNSTIDNKIILHYGSTNSKNTCYDVDYEPVEEKYVDPLVINVTDLEGSGLIAGTGGWADKAYTAAAEQTSRIFKFVVATKDLTTDGFEVNMEFNGNATKFMMKYADGKAAVFFSWGLTSKPTDRYYLDGTGTVGFESNSLYTVELGRLRVASGTNKGKDFCYMKVNGEYLKNGNTESFFYNAADDSPFSASNNKVSMLLKQANLQDVRYSEEVTYETADQISIHDLKLSNVGNDGRITLNEATGFKYEATAEHKSFVFKFKMTVDAIPEKGDYDFGQFHFFDKWGDNCIWIRNDNTFIYDDNGSPFGSQKIFTEAGTKVIEIGKLYITGGLNSGKYYIYIKADNTLINEYITTADLNNNGVYFTTADGRTFYDVNYVEEKYEEATVINIKDFANANFIRENNGWNNFNYTVAEGTNSRIFKFKVNTKTLTSDFGANLFINDGACNLWIKEDNGKHAFFFAYGLDARPTDKYYINGDGSQNKLANNSQYDVEVGRLRVSEGVNAGMDKVYVKVNGNYLYNGNTVSCFYAPANDHGFSAKSDVFSYKLDQLDLQDVNYVAPTYEEADVISVGDLSYNGKQNCNIMVFDADKAYTYTATAAHKSVVFKFKMTVDAIPEQGDYDYGQIHFSDDYGDNCIWIRNDNTFIFDDNGSPIGSQKIFAEAGTKVIEIGKLFIVDGEGTGKYYIYIKADDQIVNDYVSSGNFSEKAAIFFTGKDGRKVYSYNFVECGDAHTLTDLVAAQPATCTADGNVAYKWCSNCGKYFDANGQELTTIVEAAHHTLTDLVAAQPATCTADGNVAYYQCSVCNKYFADANATTELTTIVEAAHHTLTELVAAQPATCTEDGNVAYYQCSVCNKYFADANATTELETTVDPAGHKLEKIDAKDATCTANGNVEYYHCSECAKNFTDATGTTVATNIVVNKHHTLTKVDAKAATCTEDGNVEYYHCSVCNKNYSDANGDVEMAETTVEATGHNYADGKCTVCDAADPDYVAPKDGCKSSLTVTGLVFAIAIAGIAFKRKKENF